MMSGLVGSTARSVTTSKVDGNPVLLEIIVQLIPSSIEVYTSPLPFHATSAPAAYILVGSEGAKTIPHVPDPPCTVQLFPWLIDREITPFPANTILELVGWASTCAK